MTTLLCPSCGRQKRFLPTNLSAMTEACPCEPFTYVPVSDRGYPDTAATEIQRLLDLLLNRGLEISALKRTAQERAIQALSDAAQADDALAKKDAEIANLATGHDLYEVVRRMSVPQFKHAYVQGLYSTKPFDDIVAGMAHEFGLTVRRAAP